MLMKNTNNIKYYEDKLNKAKSYIQELLIDVRKDKCRSCCYFPDKCYKSELENNTCYKHKLHDEIEKFLND